MTKSPETPSREERLAAKLRENLRRRKGQSRAIVGNQGGNRDGNRGEDPGDSRGATGESAASLSKPGDER